MWTIRALLPNINNPLPAAPHLVSEYNNWRKLASQTDKRIVDNTWPNFKAGATAESLQRHEWGKHGIYGDFSAKEYFVYAVKTARRLDVYNTLAKASIIPGRKYNLNRFREALGFDGILKISSGPAGIYEIQFCLDTQLGLTACAYPSTQNNVLLNYPGL